MQKTSVILQILTLVLAFGRFVQCQDYKIDQIKEFDFYTNMQLPTGSEAVYVRYENDGSVYTNYDAGKVPKHSECWGASGEHCCVGLYCTPAQALRSTKVNTLETPERAISESGPVYLTLDEKADVKRIKAIQIYTNGLYEVIADVPLLAKRNTCIGIVVENCCIGICCNCIKEAVFGLTDHKLVQIS